MRTIKEQVREIAIPTGTTAGALDFTIALDTAYEKCDGIAMAEVSDGGLTHYKISIGDDNTTYMDLVHKEMLQSDKSVAPDLKYRTMDIPNEKQQIKVKVVTYATTTKDLKFDLVFRMKRKTAKS